MHYAIFQFSKCTENQNIEISVNSSFLILHVAPLRSAVWCLALLIITTMTITILITNNANYLISPNIRHDTATVVAPVELSSKFRESFYNIRRRPLL